MKKLTTAYLLMSAFALILLMNLVAAAPFAQINVTIETANNSEFNTTTPAIFVTCTDSSPGNTTTFNVTFFNATTVLNNNATSQAQVNVSTAITLSALNAPHWQNITSVRCFNASGTPAGGQNASAVNDTLWGLNINARPTISEVTSTAGYVQKGTSLTFTVNWADTNSTGTDSVRVHVCNTNTFSYPGNCVKTSCSTSTGETDGSSSCSYTVPRTTPAGQQKRYVFAIDDNNYISTTGFERTFKVAGGTTPEEDVENDAFFRAQEEEEQARLARLAAGEQEGTGTGWLVLVIVIVVAGVIGYFTLKKR